MYSWMSGISPIGINQLLRYMETVQTLGFDKHLHMTWFTQNINYTPHEALDLRIVFCHILRPTT